MEHMGKNVRTATILLSPRQTVTVTRRHKPDGRACREEFVVTIGTPNCRNRERMKLFQKAGCAFPQRTPYLNFYPQKKK